MGSVGKSSVWAAANEIYTSVPFHTENLTFEKAIAEYSNYDYNYNDYISEEIEKRGGTPAENLYRGLNFKTDPTSRQYSYYERELKDKKVGDIISSDQISSFDTQEQKAKQFADSFGDIKIMLHLVNNTKALNVSKYSTSWLENEYIAPKNTKYRITRIYNKGSVVYYDIEEA